MLTLSSASCALCFTATGIFSSSFRRSVNNTEEVHNDSIFAADDRMAGRSSESYEHHFKLCMHCLYDIKDSMVVLG